MWKHLILTRAANGKFGFYTNFAVFKTEIYGIPFKRSLREFETLKNPIFT